MFARNKVAEVGAEFFGTAILTFTVLVVAHSQIGISYFVAFAAGVAVLLMCLAMKTPMELNPAYTLALWTARQVRTMRAVAFIIAQLVGGYASYWLYRYFHGAFQGAAAHFSSHTLVAAAVGTFVFALVAGGALYQGADWLTRSVATAASYAVGVIVAGVMGLAFINPAVALGANSWVWGTYVLGSVLGAIIGVNLYGLLFAPVKTAAKAPKKAKAKK
jgi:glycerol uptake facilitator-like aquaporin